MNAIAGASELDALGVNVVSQDLLERNVAKQADSMMNAREDELDSRRLEKSLKEQEALEKKIANINSRLTSLSTTVSMKTLLRSQLLGLEESLTSINSDIVDIQGRIQDRALLVQSTNEFPSAAAQEGQPERLEKETEREYLIRTGKITPFSNISGLAKGNTLDEVPIDSIQTQPLEVAEMNTTKATLSHQNLRQPGFEVAPKTVKQERRPSAVISTALPSDSTSIENQTELDHLFDDTMAEVESDASVAARLQAEFNQEASPRATRKRKRISTKAERTSDDDFQLSGSASSGSDDNYQVVDRVRSGSKNNRKSNGLRLKSNGKRNGRKIHEDDVIDLSDDDDVILSAQDSAEEEEESLVDVDDGNEQRYQSRLEHWTTSRSRARAAALRDNASAAEIISSPDAVVDEARQPHPTEMALEFTGGFSVPGDIHPSLFDYQKTCVQWLWELHSQGCGGIVGDEMGLGKTVQIISFVAGLHHSGLLQGPVLIVAPATVMKMWVKEFHKWWPPLRVCILHSSGEASKTGSMKKAARHIVRKVVEEGHVLVTTYAGLTTYKEIMNPVEWSYAVLDEGHKIRNPDSEVSLASKQLRTVHRIILSGTPIQNNLTELWSLFDFVFPGRLGTLPIFHTQFALPINIGGYANATNVQVQTAYKCACVLRDLINPYLLRRMKADVAADLPKKSEQVLFCKLTSQQRQEYEMFLASGDMDSIFSGKRQVLYGVDILRKICNHPDLTQREALQQQKNYKYGDPSKSGKMVVVKALLELWKNQGHRTLLFSQGRQMLDILQKYVSSLDGFVSRRMDGTTPISQRQIMVDEFNNDTSIHVFLLTTRVGGLGVNLTGADRVIIFDPDWNPSTDVQARERAWRLGQKREVTIYRLMTSGTIEEKIYHRQIFKQFLTNKILRDPKQRRFFKTNDLHDLFTLGSESFDGTETGDMFSGTETMYRRPQGNNHQDKNGQSTTKETDLEDGEVSSLSKRKKKKSDGDDPETLARLGGVAALEQFGNKEQEEQTGDQNVLESIFAKSGVQSALQHDQIMDSARPELLLVDREAERIAKAAVDALRQSRRETARNPIGTPTFTGRSGGLGSGSSSSARNRAGPGSSALLAGMAQRRAEEDDQPNITISGLSDPGRAALIKRIADFLLQKGERGVPSQGIVDQFAVNIEGTQEVTLFKSMLRQVAVFDKTTKRWVIKEEFRK